MTKLNQIFKCEICGNIVEVVHAAGGTLVCCGQPMTAMTENTVDASREKHIPVVEKTETGILVKVGSVNHPMEEKHFIEWIEVQHDGKILRAQLKPGDAPQAHFQVADANVTVRAYCNLHGLWKG